MASRAKDHDNNQRPDFDEAASWMHERGRHNNVTVILVYYWKEEIHEDGDHNTADDKYRCDGGR